MILKKPVWDKMRPVFHLAAFLHGAMHLLPFLLLLAAGLEGHAHHHGEEEGMLHAVLEFQPLIIIMFAFFTLELLCALGLVKIPGLNHQHGKGEIALTLSICGLALLHYGGHLLVFFGLAPFESLWVAGAFVTVIAVEAIVSRWMKRKPLA